MSDTPPDSLARARAFAEDVKQIENVQDCHVDDWAGDGFNIFVYPSREQTPWKWDGYFDAPSLRGLMTRVHALIRKHDGHFEWADGPKMQYQRNDGHRYRNGYDRHDYKLSIRFPSHHE